MLEKLFEAIDKEILTPELKSDIEISFNEAVEAKANELVEAKKEELENSAAEYVEISLQESITALEESVEAYLGRVVEEFITEAKDSMAKSIKESQADLVIEAFEASLIAAGVEISKISEAKDESMVESELEDKTAKYDALVEEVIAKDKLINDLSKAGIVAELKEGLSLVESEKFAKLADLIPFEKGKDYLDKLETLKESVKGSKEEPKDVIVESKKDSEPSWKRFV